VFLPPCYSNDWTDKTELVLRNHSLKHCFGRVRNVEQVENSVCRFVHVKVRDLVKQMGIVRT
jgi:hypothetical protein